MERSEIRGGIDASRQSRITLRSIRATLSFSTGRCSYTSAWTTGPSQVATRNGAGRPPIDQKLRIFACTFVGPFQSVAPFQRIFSRRETRQGQNRGMQSDQMQASPRRHNRRCFKSLRASRESLFARALDASPSCSSNQTILLT
jgi:hypothetical protein